MCQLADMLYFKHHYQFRTILYSLELKNYTKLWVHGNWGRTETGDTTVCIDSTKEMKNEMYHPLCKKICDKFEDEIF